MVACLFVGAATVLANAAIAEYRTALLTLRANRVDLNLLYDHSPTEFCQVVFLSISRDKRTCVHTCLDVECGAVC